MQIDVPFTTRVTTQVAMRVDIRVDLELRVRHLRSLVGR